MENCCKCRCTSSEPDNITCYTPPFQYTPIIPPSSSAPPVESLQNGTFLPSSSPQTFLSATPTSSEAPSATPLPDQTPPPTNYYQNWRQNGDGAVHSKMKSFIVFFSTFLFVIMIVKGNQLRHRRRYRRYRAARAERLRRSVMLHQDTFGMISTPQVGFDAARYERILSKFYFQAVLPDQSNVNAESLKPNNSDIERPSQPAREEDQPEEKNATEETSSETDEDVQVPDADRDTMDESMNQSVSSISIIQTKPPPHHPSLCEVISSWASVGPAPPPSDVCCICLEGYSEGDTICVAKKPTCDHLFHKDCVLEWMKTNDKCPLCRINLLF